MHYLTENTPPHHFSLHLICYKKRLQAVLGTWPNYTAYRRASVTLPCRHIMAISSLLENKMDRTKLFHAAIRTARLRMKSNFEILGDRCRKEHSSEFLREACNVVSGSIGILCVLVLKESRGFGNATRGSLS
jgi:hypothetical protein